MDLLLSGRRAVVTGASRGIGLAVARALTAEGADLALVARHREPLEQAATDLAARSGRTVLPIAADTGDDAAVRAMVERVVAELGGVDILVNAAATPASAAPAVSLAELTDEMMREQFEVKVLGYLRCARAVAPYMISAGWGRIINISGLNARSTGSLVGSVRNVAVAAMAKNLADELGPAGINVTVVHPGTTVTERTPALVRALAERRGESEAQVRARMDAATSIGRMVTAEEVADIVTFLASPRSVAMTGDPVVVGGGARGSIYY